MELEISSPKLGDLTHSDCNSDPDEKEVSDDDDDDRNHKHRRRETRSQSLERDVPNPVFTRPCRKRNKPFPNGNHFRESDSQTSAAWKNFNSNNLEKDFSGKFDKRRPGHASTARSTLDLNQRFRPNQLFPGDPSLARGRGRDLGLWNQRDSRFSADLASQVVQGSFPPSLFAGRGLPNVSNAQNAPWNAFGLIPGIPTGNLDTSHPIGLQGPLRPPIPSTLNIGIPRQRCRDFEERGFCLRGDMCPMEHGVHRIVIEDVQSLSQFNLPVSLPSTHLLGPSGGPGPGSLASISSSSVGSINNKGLHSKTSRPGFADDGLGLNGSYSGADLYDPDQPLWNNSGHETSNALLGLHSSKIEETESSMNGDPSDNEFPARGVGNPVGSNVTSVWGRIGSSKGRLDAKEKIDPAVSSSDYLENDSKEDKMALIGIQSSARQGKQAVSEDAPGPKPLDSSVKAQFDTTRNTRKPSQKALRTLFVNGIPLQSNKREKLLSHFQKFGEVIDIYIPVNSERAFVQFSKREEAESAYKAPDAVMGNRFIKLWWANRDSVPDDGISNSNHVSASPHGGAATSIQLPPHSSVASSKKDNPQVAAAAAALRNSMVQTHDSLHASDTLRPVVTNGSKVVPPPQQQKKLEQLKEELRKKQEMLEQKRNDFRRKLVKLEKQATGSKGDMDSEQAAKGPKLAAEVVDASTPRASESVADKPVDKNKPGENTVAHSPKTTATVELQEFTSSKQHLVRPFAPAGPPFLANRYKIDNRPTAFNILPPLPAGFANVAAVREHFSPYGDISNVELEDVDICNSGNDSEPSKDCSARVSFLTRRSAEKAFTTGKCWQGHDLKFVWSASSTPRSDPSGRENSPSTCKGSLLDANIKSEEAPSGSKEVAAPTGSQEVALPENVKPEDEEKRRSAEEDTEDTKQGPNPTSEKNESNQGGDNTL